MCFNCRHRHQVCAQVYWGRLDFPKDAHAIIEPRCDSPRYAGGLPLVSTRALTHEVSKSCEFVMSVSHDPSWSIFPCLRQLFFRQCRIAPIECRTVQLCFLAEKCLSRAVQYFDLLFRALVRSNRPRSTFDSVCSGHREQRRACWLKPSLSSSHQSSCLMGGRLDTGAPSSRPCWVRASRRARASIMWCVLAFAAFALALPFQHHGVIKLARRVGPSF